jgi:hypothetical protein
MGKHSETLAEKLERMTAPEPNTGCLIFTGTWQSRGYGMVNLGLGSGERLLAHRAAWEQAHGPVPEDMTIDHLCGVKACVNPDHMEIVSRVENTIRAHLGVRWTRCHRGHDLTNPANLLIAVRKDGRQHRQCAACHAMHQGRTRVRKAER